MKYILPFLLVILISGCRMVTFTDNTGKKIQYFNFGYDTKVGKVTLKSPQGSEVIIENLDTTNKALDVAAEAISKVPIVPVP